MFLFLFQVGTDVSSYLSNKKEDTACPSPPSVKAGSEKSSVTVTSKTSHTTKKRAPPPPPGFFRNTTTNTNTAMPPFTEPSTSVPPYNSSIPTSNLFTPTANPVMAALRDQYVLAEFKKRELLTQQYELQQMFIATALQGMCSLPALPSLPYAQTSSVPGAPPIYLVTNSVPMNTSVRITDVPSGFDANSGNYR